MSLHLFVIDDELKTVLRELEVHLGIRLDEAVVNKIFADSGNYSQLDEEKHYTLYKSSNSWFAWVIEGIVDVHEPETIWLQSRFGLRKQKQFEAFFKDKP